MYESVVRARQSDEWSSRTARLYTGEASHRTQRDNTSKLQCGHRDTGETMRTGTITRADTNMEAGIEPGWPSRSDRANCGGLALLHAQRMCRPYSARDMLWSRNHTDVTANPVLM